MFENHKFVTMTVPKKGLEPLRLTAIASKAIVAAFHHFGIKAVPKGFEPLICESKSHVLPLYYRTISTG